MGFPSTTTEGSRNTRNWLYLSQRLLNGSGSPEGKVKGRLGAFYIDEDSGAVYSKGGKEGTDEGWRLMSSSGGLVTSLPAKAVVGETIVYQAAAGVLWQLFYDGEGEYPWKKIGGPPLISKTTAENSTASTSYVTLANSPSITTPAVKMEATVRIGGRIVVTGGPAFVSRPLFTSPGGVEVAGTAEEYNSGSPHGVSVFSPVALATGTAYTLRYKTSVGTAFFAYRFIEIDPLRVG